MSYRVEILRSASAIYIKVSTPITRQCDTRTTYNGEADGGGREPATPLLDILGPFVVILEAVGRDTDDLYIALSEIRRSRP